MGRRIRVITGIFLAALALHGCGGGGGGGGSDDTNGSNPSSPSPESAPVSPDENAGTSLYSVTVLASPGGDCYAVAINDAGEITGNCRNNQGGTDALLWNGNRMQIIAQSAQTSDINNHGQVVGWMESPSGLQPFAHQQRLNLLNVAGNARALAVNDFGVIAGRLSEGTEKSFLEKDGQSEVIAPDINGYAVAMNNMGQVVLKAVAPDRVSAMLWNQGGISEVGSLGGKSTQVQDINNAGQIVGWSETAAGRYHAFFWRNGEMTDLAQSPEEHSSAVAINDRGQILIKSSTATADRAYLWEDGKFTDLGSFGAGFVEVTDMNSQGQIVGWLLTAKNEIRAFVATPR